MPKVTMRKPTKTTSKDSKKPAKGKMKKGKC